MNCKPDFSNKHKTDNDIVLNKDRKLFLENEEIADIFNNSFGSIVENLNLEQWNKSSTSPSVCNRLNDISDIIKKYINYPSITKIKEKIQNIKKLAFRSVTTEEAKKVIKDLKTNKSVDGEIPV